MVAHSWSTRLKKNAEKCASDTLRVTFAYVRRILCWDPQHLPRQLQQIKNSRHEKCLSKTFKLLTFKSYKISFLLQEMLPFGVYYKLFLLIFKDVCKNEVYTDIINIVLHFLKYITDMLRVGSRIFANIWDRVLCELTIGSRCLLPFVLRSPITDVTELLNLLLIIR